jgi:hypothetical protein
MSVEARKTMSSRKRREAQVAAVVVLVCFSIVAGTRLEKAVTPRASRAQCKQMLERYLDHQAHVRHRDATSAALTDAKRQARVKPAYDTDLQRCHAQLSVPQVQCGIASPTMDALEQCLQ